MSLGEVRSVVPAAAELSREWVESDKLNFTVTKRKLRYTMSQGEGEFTSHREFNAPVYALVATNKPDEVLGVVKGRYSIVQNAELIRSTTFAIVSEAERRGISAELFQQAKIIDDVARSYSYRQYLFGKDESGFVRRIILRNSFDGKSSFGLYAGYIDSFCTNGMIFGSYEDTRLVHSGNETITRVVNAIGRCFERWDVARVMLKSMQKRLVRDEWVPKIVECVNDWSPTARDVVVRHVLDREFPNRGANMWAVYSGMTYYASHPGRIGRVGSDSTLFPNVTHKRSMSVLRALPKMKEVVHQLAEAA